MTKLVIVESPAKCKKIEGFLGPGYKCIASFGHIRDLANGLQGIDIKNNFKPSYRMLPGKSRYIKPLRAAIKKADEVILATDDDREGEAIAWHLCDAFNLSVTTTKRIIFHEITKSAVKKAINNPTTVDMNKVNAQQARQILDCLVGFTISPILWANISRKSGLSAGRCQTPALRLIHDNQQDINNAPGRVAYDTTGYFTDKNLEFKLNYHHENEMDGFLKKSVEWEHVYTCSKPVAKKKQPPLPFTTSTLQQKASNILHFSPKRTMTTAQKLYEQGYITYMRTDSRTYSKEFISTAKKFIEDKWSEDYVNDNIYDLSQRNTAKKATKKTSKKAKAKTDDNAQEAHEAIRPTKIIKTTLPTDAGQKRLYELIWSNTVESCMSPAEYNLLSAKITAPEKHSYKFSTELITFPGWLTVRGYEKENVIYDFLGQSPQNTIIPYKKITSKMTLKDLKTHYTEARLVQQMEKVGIGRPSTFSSLVSKIQDRGYVKKGDVKGKQLECVDFMLEGKELSEEESIRKFGEEKNKLIIEPTGIMVIEFLIKQFDPLFVYPYTKNMEDTLDEIAKGAKLWQSLCQSCYDEMRELASKIQKNNKELIQIDDNHIYMIAKYGPVVKYEKDGETVFKSAKKDLDMDKLKNGKYTLEEILAPKPSFTGKRLGSYKNEDVLLKKGKYGLYIVCGDNKYSLKGIRKNENNIKLEDILDILMGNKSSNPNVLAILNENFSVRKGKYGPYIFYKTSFMKKPRFLNLKGKDWKSMQKGELVEWCQETYGV
jgi:DNA topoisomerase-1